MIWIINRKWTVMLLMLNLIVNTTPVFFLQIKQHIYNMSIFSYNQLILEWNPSCIMCLLFKYNSIPILKFNNSQSHYTVMRIARHVEPGARIREGWIPTLQYAIRIFKMVLHLGQNFHWFTICRAKEMKLLVGNS